MLPATTRSSRRHGPSSKASLLAVERLLGDAREARKAGKLQRALSSCEKALALNPFSIDALCTYGGLAIEAGRPDVALTVGARAIKAAPEFADGYRCLGAGQRHCGQLQNAIASLARAIELRPDHAETLIELSLAFIDAGDLGAAEPFVNRLLDRDPGMGSAQTVLGRFYGGSGRIDDAIAAHRRAIALDPGRAEAHYHLGDVLRDAGDVEGSIAACNRAIALAPNAPASWSALLLALQCSDRVSARDIAARHREFGAFFGRQLRSLPSLATAPRDGRRLRIGYLSANFRRHALVKFFEPLLLSHDRSQFEVHCYFNGPVADDITLQIRDRVEHFASVWGMRDGHFAAQIRRDSIDILVDLDGHTPNNRLGVFFLRPAPVQVTWLGYLSTTGVGAIDYRLTDEFADPRGMTEALHTEALWRLPDTAWCYRPYDEAPDAGPAPCASNDYVTFVCLNSPSKITSTALDLWARVLRRVPRSRLLLHVSPQTTRHAELMAYFAQRGIAPERITLLDRQPIDQYLRTYSQADIGLDTFPCAGGTTTCDALWMGVPVVTLAGDRSFSRAGASILSNMGLADLVADTADRYVAAAVELARDRSRLQQLRSSLRARMQASPLTNAAQFARNMEAAFGAMWDRRVTRRADDRAVSINATPTP